MKYAIENLSNDESKTLRKEIIRAYIIGSLLGIMMSFLLGIVLLMKNSTLATKDFYFLFLIITGAIFITSITVKNLHLDIYKGVKHLYKYPVTQKLSFMDNEPGLGGEKMKYYLISEEKRFSVSEEEYNKMQINDLVIEHETPKSGFSLKVVFNSGLNC